MSNRTAPRSALLRAAPLALLAFALAACGRGAPPPADRARRASLADPVTLIVQPSSSGQAALPGLPFDTLLGVQVIDGGGAPVVGATVRFDPPATGPTASLDQRLATSDEAGIAQVGAWAGVVPGSYVVTASVDQGGSTVSVDLALTNLPQPALTTVFQEGFEGGLGGFTAETLSGVAGWTVLDHPENVSVTSLLNPFAVTLPDAGSHLAAAGGTHVVWFGEPSTGSYIGSDFPAQTPKSGGTSAVAQAGILTSPTVDLTGYAAATLEFDSWWEIEGFSGVAGQVYDLMEVSASRDGGATWISLGQLNPTIPTNATSDTGFTSGGSSSAPVWRHYVYDLSKVVGGPAQLRFYFDTGDEMYNGFRGWTIDDVVVQGGAELPAPAIAALTPAIGTTDDLLVAQGSNFVQGSVFSIGATQVPVVTVVGSSTAFLQVPGGLAPGTYDVTVANPDGKLSIAYDAFTFVAAPSPTVTSISPADGQAGVHQVVTVKGTDFVDGASVTVGGQPAGSVTWVDAGTLSVDFPPLPVGTYNVTVANPNGQAGTLFGAYQVGTSLQPWLQLTAPAAGAKLAAGSITTIQWQSAGVTTVTLELYAGGLPVATLATDLDAVDGRWDWAVPPDQELRADYTIRIVDQAGLAPTAESGVFEVVPPTAPSTTTLSATPLSPVYGDAVLLQALVAPTVPSGLTPTGFVHFLDDGVELGMVALDLLGQAELQVLAFDAGAHPLTAVYDGDVSFDPSSGALTLSVAKAPQAIAFTPPAAAVFGQAAVDLAPYASGGGSGNPITFTVVSGPGTLSGPGLTTLGFTGAGTVVVRASQAGNLDYEAAPPVDGSIVVDKAEATVTLAGLAQTYDGTPRVATVTTVPPGLAVTITYDGGAAPPTGAGSYAVEAAVDDPNYQGWDTGTLVVAKADATVTLAGLAQTYDGTPRLATATTSPPGLPVTFTYDGSASAPTNAGSYAVVGTISDANHQGSASGTLVVAKAAATVTLAGLAQTYDGTPRVATATTSPAGLPVTFTYDGSATAPTNAGSYAVVGTIADANHTGSATGTLVVGKADATVTLASLAQTYDGTPRVATATTSPAGLPVTFTYDGSATAPTSAGSYAVVGTIADANHTGSASGTLVVGKADATVTLANLAQTYDGTPRAVTATTSPAGLPVTFTYDGSANAPTSAGSYAVVGTIADANHTGSATGTLVVGKAAATVTLAGLAQTYDGTPRVATATTNPGGLTVTITYDGSAAAPTNAGSYAVVGTIADANHQGSASGTLVVGKAAATVTLAGLAQTYDGTPRVATATTNPGGLTVTLTYDGSATAPTSAGSYAVVGTISDANRQGSATGTLVVAKASATVTLASLAQTYDGTPRVATATTSPAGLTVAFTYDGSATAPTHAGSYTVVGTISDANRQGSATGTLVVAKAAQTLAFTPPAHATFGDAPVDLTPFATAGSGAAVTFEVASGPGVLTGSSLAFGGAGSVVVTAHQPGTGDYQAAADVQGTIAVAQAPTTLAVASSRTPARVNQPVTLTATVGAPARAGAPTGSVTFSDGTAELGRATLVNGVASLRLSSLAKGSHAVTATYAGATDFAGSSGTLEGAQVVSDSPPVAGSGTALQLDGETRWAEIADPSGTLQSVRTVELWAKAAPGTGAACLAQLGTGADRRFGLCLTAARDGLEVRRGEGVATVPVALAQAWHHLALVEQDDGSTLLVIDGSAAATLEGGLGGVALRGPSAARAWPSLVVGAGDTAGAEPFAGQVDELRLWTTARTADALAASAREPVSGDAPGLLGLWRMDEGEGASLYDAGPGHLVATLAGAAPEAWVASTAWTRRTAREEHALAPFTAGYDADGDDVVVTVVDAPAHGQATVAGAGVAYHPAAGFVGVDHFTCQVASGGATSRFTTEVAVEAATTCQVDADCAGGDTCVSNVCKAPEKGGGGCGCGTGNGGASAILLALFVLAFLPRRRRA